MSSVRLLLPFQETLTIRTLPTLATAGLRSPTSAMQIELTTLLDMEAYRRPFARWMYSAESLFIGSLEHSRDSIRRLI
jgi:hypothetical protein